MFTQDTGGNIAFYSQNETYEADNLEPLPKRPYFYSEDDQIIDDSIPGMLDHALPVWEGDPSLRPCFYSDDDQIIDDFWERDPSFEVAMTTTNKEKGHGNSLEAMMKFQVLKNEQLNGTSTMDDEDVSGRSQAWLMTKEDKDFLTSHGHTWRKGMWSKEETETLMQNIESYMNTHGFTDAREIIFEISKGKRKDFYRAIATGLNRPLFAVYRRVVRMYDDRNHVGKYTHEEVEKLKELHIQHGNDWVKIGAALGRSASSVKDRCRRMVNICNTGKWTEDEEQRLTDIIHELTSTGPTDSVTQGVPWSAVAERVGSRSEKQCRSKWLNYLNWKQSGGTEWTKKDEASFILKLAELDVADENDIQWDLLAQGWSSARSPQWLRNKWQNMKRQIANYKDISFPVLIRQLQLSQKNRKHKNCKYKPDLLENESESEVPNTNSFSSVQNAHSSIFTLEDHGAIFPFSMPTLHTPDQVTNAPSTDSPSAAVDSVPVAPNSKTQ
uniref:Cyclin-D-binding Myb-like transcription factor 1 n=1 Tax=Jaculus jaculus TaxID=51337 RepID=A0A8C5KH08_JACJA